MVLTADLHAAKRWVRGRFIALGEGGGPRSSAHPEAVSTASTSTPPHEKGCVSAAFPFSSFLVAVRLSRSVPLGILSLSPPSSEDNLEQTTAKKSLIETELVTKAPLEEDTTLFTTDFLLHSKACVATPLTRQMPRSTNTQSACSTNTRFSPSCLPLSSYATPPFFLDTYTFGNDDNLSSRSCRCCHGGTIMLVAIANRSKARFHQPMSSSELQRRCCGTLLASDEGCVVGNDSRCFWNSSYTKNSLPQF
ncbi:hypothetical protein HN011_002738, partial [Eciton burchellii]